MVTEAEAYVAMHELRLDYAIGKSDDAQIDLLKKTFDKKAFDGKYFFEVLDEPQIDSLAVTLALGILTPEQRTSVTTKFPAICWDKYTEESFFDAISQATTEVSEFSEKLKKLGKDDLDSDGWNNFINVRVANRPIGLFLRETVRLARSDDSDSE
jgi:hypothetical protein